MRTAGVPTTSKALSRTSRIGNLTRRATGPLSQTMGTALVTQGALFATGPLVARMLGVEDRGYLASLTLWPTIIGTIAIWGLPTAITYERSSRGPLPKSLAARVLAVALLQCIIAVMIHAFILIFITTDVWTAARSAAVVSLLLGPAFIARDFTLAPLQGARSFRLFNAARLSHIAIYLPGIALLYLFHRGSLNSIVSISLLASMMISVTAIVAYRRSSTQPPDGDDTRTLGELLKFGQQAHLGRLMPVERFRADQVAVVFFLTPAALGIYVVAIAFTNVIRFLTQAIGYVAFPTVANIGDDVLARKAMWKYVRISAVLTGVIMVVLFALGPELIRILFGREFESAGTVLQILLPGVGFVSVRRVMAESLRGGGLGKATSLSELATTVVFLACIYPMTSLWELNGVAGSVSLAEGLGFLVLLVLFSRNNSTSSTSVKPGI